MSASPATPPGLPPTILHCVAANAVAFPERIALEVLDPRAGGTAPVQRLTYRAVWGRAGALAAALGAVEAGPEGPMVAILLPNGADHAVAYLAAGLAGAAAVPVNNRLAEPEVAYVLRDSGASVVLSGAPFVELARAAAAGTGARVVDVATVAATGPAPDPLALRSDPNDLAVIAYTSGTTGFSKGSRCGAGDWLTRLFQWGWTFGLGPEQVLSVPGPLFHLSYGGLTLAALTIGGRARIMTAFDPAVALDEYREHSHWAFLVPSMLAMIADELRARGGQPLDALRVMLSSGAPGPLSLLDAAFDVFPKARITEAYGWTEGGWVTYEVKDRAALVAHSVGWPMVGTEVGVRGGDGEPLGVGEAGEVVARSLVPFRGYLGNPQASAAALTADGFTRSGDVGIWLEDGRLSIVDRVKDMIISGGENVYCAEVERVLVEHAAVAEVAVVGLPDERWGERVTAAVVARAGVTADPAAIIAFCRERLAGYKCPREVVLLDDLPRNPMGKVQKFRLLEQLASAPG